MFFLHNSGIRHMHPNLSYPATPFQFDHNGTGEHHHVMFPG